MPTENLSHDWYRDLDALLEKLAPKDGIRISFHHHLRMGDRVVSQVLSGFTKAGIRDLTLCVSSVIGPACAAVLEGIRSGTIRKLETTGLKSPLSEAVSGGEMDVPVEFRSHGDRARAIREGELPIDIAFIAVSAVDRGKNVNGVDGPNCFGSLGYAQVDAAYAAVTVAVSDFVPEADLEYVSIPGAQIDYVLLTDRIGDRHLISGGTLRSSANPLQEMIASRTMDILNTLGSVHEGWSYQAGSGAASLAVTRLVASCMRERGIRGVFASGGITGHLVRLLEEGLFGTLYDVQSFDNEATISLKQNTNHIEMSAGRYADPGMPENIAGQLDVMILSAAEVGTDFSVNSLTGTNGRILGALGGAPDTAAGASLTIAVLPAFRGRIPSIHEHVRTVCTPGRDVDIVVTERGASVNPGRGDLLSALSGNSSIGDDFIMPIEKLRQSIHAITGTPGYPHRDGRVVGTVYYRDGSVLDTLRMS